MSLNIKEMLDGNPVRLRYVDRYSTCRVNNRESVAEHSYFVGLYACMIGHWLCESQKDVRLDNRTQINWRSLMLRSMVHDMEEACTGDWPRHFKHSDATLRDELDRVAGKALYMMSVALAGLGPLSEEIRYQWLHAKNEEIEGRIVAFADFLSVLSYVSQEHFSGNVSAMEHVQHLDEYYKDFEHESFNRLRPLVEQAGEFLKTLFVDLRRSVFAERKG